MLFTCLHKQRHQRTQSVDLTGTAWALKHKWNRRRRHRQVIGIFNSDKHFCENVVQQHCGNEYARELFEEVTLGDCVGCPVVECV